VERGAVPDVPIRSHPKLGDWLRNRGVDVGSGKGTLDAAAIQKLLVRKNLPGDVRRALEARLFENAIGAKKLKAALVAADADGRIREAFRYCGTHTGRWIGVGLQPHNLPRGFDSRVEERTARVVALVLARDVAGLCRFAEEIGLRIEDVLSALVRPCIVAPSGRVLGVVDYAQIEARVLLWVAGDDDGLRAFREGEDVYSRMAEKLYGVERGSIAKGDPRRMLGKVAVLGLGYGMGAPAFQAFAAAQGVDWSAVPFLPVQVVESWRDSVPLVAGQNQDEWFESRTGGLWQRLNGAAKEVVQRGPGTARSVGCLTLHMQASDLIMVLPSGRFLRYREARLEKAKDKSYASVHFTVRKRRVVGYGGLWTENAVQAIARDLIAAALPRVEDAELPVVLHVHDEVVAELEASAASTDMKRMVALCEELPPWAAGLPLKAEGFLTDRYRK
jgi:DNA polymerase